MTHIARRAASTAAGALAVLALVATGAQAKSTHITGQQTTIAPSAQLVKFVAKHNVTVTALGAASISNGTITLPIWGGYITGSQTVAAVRMSGTLRIVHGTHALVLRRFVLTKNGHRYLLSATAGKRVLNIAWVTWSTTSVSGAQRTLSGRLYLAAQAARTINRMFGSQLVKAGADIGTLTSTITTA